MYSITNGKNVYEITMDQAEQLRKVIIDHYNKVGSIEAFSEDDFQALDSLDIYLDEVAEMCDVDEMEFYDAWEYDETVPTKYRRSVA